MKGQVFLSFHLSQRRQLTGCLSPSPGCDVMMSSRYYNDVIAQIIPQETASHIQHWSGLLLSIASQLLVELGDTEIISKPQIE